MTSPNKQQKKLIENTEGIYLADAGAGTGKTFTITRRYVNLLEKGVEPEQIFLATYTRNAADEMMERIMEKADVSEARIFDAAISTFHSHCQKVLERNGLNAPGIIGIETRLTEDIRVMESQIRERQEFENFYSSFRDNNPEYTDYYRLVEEPSNLLDLVKSLASKGVVPEKEGWFRQTENYLDGDKDGFYSLFRELNAPRKEGNKQSKLRGKLSRFDTKTYLEDAPEKEELRGDDGTKSVRRDFCRKAFDEDREELKSFVHDVYYSYIQYCLRRNYLNFGFLMMFTYLLLHENPSVRRQESFDYLMIDEFQDTNEIQFKLALLMAQEPNICAVGDWKQSIYSFQYAEVENIQEFRQRLEKFSGELNTGEKRVEFGIDRVEKISLKKNYRSTQDILDLSEESLGLKGSKYETVEEQDITSLESEKQLQDSEIKKIVSQNEPEAILTKIQELVSDQSYGDEGEEKSIGYDDIAVLTRTRSLGLELQEKARENGIPAAYEAGIELFKTDPAVLLLAWLRIINSDGRRGWAVVLEEAGYGIEEAKKIVEEEQYPENMQEFRQELGEQESIKAVARKVFRRYGTVDAASDKIIEVLTDTFSSSFMNTGQLIRFIEENIEEDEIYQVDSSERQNTVKIQTIHKAKGLEYPVVFVSGVNRGVFPSWGFNRSSIIYEDLIGLRQKKIYSSQEYAYNYDNWRAEILSKCLSGSYDEERRLMYVAMTRAEQHLFITAEKARESRFYEELDVPEEELQPGLEEVSFEEEEKPVLELERPREQPLKKSVRSVLDLGETEGKGADYGNKVHQFAERYAKGEDVEPRNEDEEKVKEVIDSLEGELLAEEPIKIPEQVGGRKVVYHGIIDLLHVTDDKVEIIDWKTSSREKEDEYLKQLGLYQKGIERIPRFSGKEVEKRLVFTGE